MVREETKALYDGFAADDKVSFFAGYLYLKYTKHFYYYSLLMQGIEAEPPEEEIDESIAEMLQMLCQAIADGSMSLETSLYHGKVVQKEDARKILTLDVDIDITPSERVMPFKIARQMLVESPGVIAAAPCVCRLYTDSDCFPKDQEICLFVGNPHAEFMAAQNPMARLVSREEALQILDVAHENGFVHCAYFEAGVGERLNAICNCCSCCCGGMKAWNMTEGAVPILAPSGYVAEINDECDACEECIEPCQFNAISVDEKGDSVVINEVMCMGCGVCESVCTREAITLRREPSKGDPLDIDEMMGRTG